MSKDKTQGIVAGKIDLNKKASEFLYEIASALKSGYYGDHIMLTLCDDEDVEAENPIFITMYLSRGTEIEQVAKDLGAAEPVLEPSDISVPKSAKH